MGAAALSGRSKDGTSLVTGATSNIGTAIAIAFGAEGAHVAVSGRDAERGQEVVDAIRRAGGRADFVRADLDGSAARSRALADEATRVLGARIGVLVNAGSTRPSPRRTRTSRPSTRCTGST